MNALPITRDEWRVVDRDGEPNRMTSTEPQARALLAYLDILHAEKGDRYARGPHGLEHRQVTEWESA